MFLMNPLLYMLTGKIVYGQLHGNVLTTITSLLFFMKLFIVYFISQRPTVTIWNAVKIPNSLTVILSWLFIAFILKGLKYSLVSTTL